MADMEPQLDQETSRQLDKWVEAKRNRDYASADKIRALLEAKGIKAEQVRPHVWEAPGQRKQGSHGPPQDGAFRMGNRAMGGDRGAPLLSSGLPMTSGAPPRTGMPPGIDASVGDWPCSACGNWNWARRKECNQCNAAKDGLCAVKGTIAGTKRMGEGGGFKEFDGAAVRASRGPYPDAHPNRRGCHQGPTLALPRPQHKLPRLRTLRANGTALRLPHHSPLPHAQDETRKRRALTEKSEKEERKAEKKKCEYCKRFACLC